MQRGWPRTKVLTPAATLSAMVVLVVLKATWYAYDHRKGASYTRSSLNGTISIVLEAAKATCSTNPNQALTPLMFRGQRNSLMDQMVESAGANSSFF